MSFSDLSTLNAVLNALSAVLLCVGYRHIRRGRVERHRTIMLSALGVSALFLVSYLAYHARVGSIPYPHHDWTRPVYFAILIPHVLLAALNVPFIVALVVRALRGDYARHRKLARWVFPSWLFVSASGVAVYLMLYHL